MARAKTLPADWENRVSVTKRFFGTLIERESIPESLAGKGAFPDLVRALLRVDQIERGKISFLVAVAPPVGNFFNGLHGGAVAAIADEVGRACVKTVAGDGDFFLGEQSISYLSAARINAEVVVNASILRHGRSVSVVSVEFRSKEKNRLLYSAKATYYSLKAIASL